MNLTNCFTNEKYVIRSRIYEKKLRDILCMFCFDIKAFNVSQITAISRPAINQLYACIRYRIVHEL